MLFFSERPGKGKRALARDALFLACAFLGRGKGKGLLTLFLAFKISLKGRWREKARASLWQGLLFAFLFGREG